MPVTLSLDPTVSLIMLAGIYYGARIDHRDPGQHSG